MLSDQNLIGFSVDHARKVLEGTGYEVAVSFDDQDMHLITSDYNPYRINVIEKYGIIIAVTGRG